MSNYHRLYINGGLYFFTLVTHERKPLLCSEQALTRLKAAFRYTIKKHPFHISGLVILPDHLHCIWQLPANDHDFSSRWKIIKHYFSIGMAGDANERREKNIWQKRFWEHLIRDEEDFQNCLNYIHYNPVKHGYVERPCDWTYSSFKRCVKQELYEATLGSSAEPEKIKGMKFE